MGLFDMFKGGAPLEITPRRAMTVSLIYCMGADGEIDPEEIGHLLSVWAAAPRARTWTAA